jgi:hypothetical protein
MEKAIEKGREFILEAQKKKEHNINPYRRPVDFNAKDKVWVSIKP